MLERTNASAQVVVMNVCKLHSCMRAAILFVGGR